MRKHLDTYRRWVDPALGRTRPRVGLELGYIHEQGNVHIVVPDRM